MGEVRRVVILFSLVLMFGSPADQSSAEVLSMNQIDERCLRTGYGSGVSRYCYYHRKGIAPATAETLVYRFHGAGARVKITKRLAAGIISVHRRINGSYPVIISATYGSTWLLVRQRANSPYSGKLEKYLNTFQPQVERRLGVRSVSRLYWGSSMGGFNATSAALAAPNKVARVLAFCPMFNGINPYSDRNQVRRYLARNVGAQYSRVVGAFGLARQHMPLNVIYNSDGVVPRVNRLRSGVGTRFFLVANRRDEFAFAEGTRGVARRLQQTGDLGYMQWLPGGHCENMPLIAGYARAAAGMP